jgi:hypothetical protein
MRRTIRAGIAITALFAVAVAQAQEQTNYAELKRLGEAAQARAFAEKAQATMVARSIGWPVRAVDPVTGRTIEVRRVDANGKLEYLQTDNRNANITTRAARVWSGGGAGLALSGNGVILREWDSGSAMTTHLELAGRVTAVDGAPSAGHSTHVAGTMIGNGTLAPNGNAGFMKGASFAATLRSFDWDSDVAEATTEAAMNPPMVLSNHSYSITHGWTWDSSSGYIWYGNIADSTTEESGFGQYDQDCVDWDTLAYNAPYYLHCQSAGNDRGEGPPSQPTLHWFWTGSAWQQTNSVTRQLDGGAAGYDCISNMGIAKNVLTVAAVDDVASYTSPSSVIMSDFSSWGPADDGRIKPDISANGVEVTSAWNNATNGFNTINGTSMATPNVTGSLGLLVQHYRSTHSNQNMRAATLKGLAIHTADECGSSTGPDYRFGWGLLNTEAAAKVIINDQANPDVIRESSLPNAGVHTYRVTSNGTTPMRFTLSWTDPASTVQTGLNNRTPRLKNDLDMRVTIGATTYYPWKLNPLSPASAATQGENNVDNVEVIDIPAPAAGTYTITIDHDGTLAAAQAYSLIATGPVVTPIMSNFTINGTWITGGNSTNGTVTINAAAPAGGYKVYPRVSPAGVFNINSPVIIPQGQTSKTFPIVGAGNVSENTPYSVFMDAGYKSLGVAGTLVPMRLNLMTVTPNPVQANHNLTLTVGINGPAPAGGLVLDIQRSPTFWIQAPLTMTIAAGQSQKTILIPIKAGAPAITNARLTVVQHIGGGTVSLSKLFNIIP